jgi:hypothetical protein
MNAKTKTILVLALVGVLAIAAFLVFRNRSGADVRVAFRIAVTPAEQSEFVVEQANSARFKYAMGKQSGVKPVLAQRLAVRPLPNSSLLEARVAVETQEQARRYLEAFVPTLQELCRGRAEVALETPP